MVYSSAPMRSYHIKHPYNNQMEVNMAHAVANHSPEVTILADMLESIFPNDSWDDNVHKTAYRVLKYWQEFAPKDINFQLTAFPSEVNQMIAVTNIEFSSLCSHHLLPFFGIAHVGYIPAQLAIGLSKIPRVVDHFANRPQTQEKMTAQIAKFLKHELQAMGVAVVVIGKHTCMACRGVRKHNGHMVTAEMRGVFLTAPAARQEFLDLTRTEVML